MAEVLLQHHFHGAGVDAHVSSAGLYVGGAPATPHGVTAMARRQLDLTHHVSRRVDRELITAADLIVGMAREHVREVAVIEASALARTFTLKEFVLATERVGPRRRDEAFDEWLTRMGQGRRRDTLLGIGHDEALDVEDPVGRSLSEYERTAAELDDLLGRVVAAGWVAGSVEQSA